MSHCKVNEHLWKKLWVNHKIIIFTFDVPDSQVLLLHCYYQAYLPKKVGSDHRPSICFVELCHFYSLLFSAD